MTICKTNSSKALGLSALCLSLALAEAGAQTLIPFDISAGQVIPDDECALRVTILGCSNRASARGGYDRLTTMKLHVTPPGGGPMVTYEPFGPFLQPVNANLNDGSPHSFVISDTFVADSRITITGRSWRWTGSGNSNGDWSLFQEENSNVGNSDNMVVVLRDGDPAPNLPGFNGQASARSYIEPYLDANTGRVQLGPNDAIYLFELAAPNSSASAYDLQDMVVLVTLGETPMGLTPSCD